jgi:mono/diheme cytochrome c family protein
LEIKGSRTFTQDRSRTNSVDHPSFGGLEMRASGWFWQGLAGITCAVAVACSSGGTGDLNKTPDDTSTDNEDAGAGSADNTKVGATGDGDAKAGADYVAKRNCAKCHTADMAGSTAPLTGYPDTVSLYSPNLTPDPETGIGSWNASQLAEAIRDGIDNEGMVLCPQMNHYKTMPDVEVNAIIAYLKSLPPIKRQIPGSICPPLKSKR